MLWNEDESYEPVPFEKEADLEEAVLLVAGPLFGSERFYLDVKKRIGRKRGKWNIPDGYLVDLSSTREPLLYVVENELGRHEPLKHIAAQILEFSLAFETSPRQVKEIVKESLRQDSEAFRQCENFPRRREDFNRCPAGRSINSNECQPAIRGIFSLWFCIGHCQTPRFWRL